MKPDRDEQVMAKFDQLRAELAREQERSVFAAIFRAPWPAPAFKLGGLKAEVERPDPFMLRVRMSLPVLLEPRHLIRLDYEEPEVRCGPFTSPSGKRWAVVKDRRTGRRSVVDWPMARPTERGRSMSLLDWCS